MVWASHPTPLRLATAAWVTAVQITLYPIFSNLGFKYVPPAELEKVEVAEEKDSSEPLVFTETDGWLRVGGSNYLYKLGEEICKFGAAEKTSQQ